MEVVGRQEFQRPQHEEFHRVAGNRYAFWFPPGDPDNAIAWRRDRWAFVSNASIEVPYFEGHPTDMPVVRLHRLATGQDAIFVNIHNPADTARHPRQKRFRDEALRREIAAVWGLSARYQVPVFLTGDIHGDRGCSLLLQLLLGLAGDARTVLDYVTRLSLLQYRFRWLWGGDWIGVPMEELPAAFLKAKDACDPEMHW